jgi:DHA1 family multidrug resistance protein-like MFS transporter
MIKKKSQKVYMIFVLYLLQQVAANLGHPVTPQFVSNLGIEDYMFGVFFASMSVGLMIGGIVWGHLGERNNKKYLIFTGLIIYGLGQFGFGYLNNQYLMTIARIFSGFGAAAAVTLFVSQIVESSPKDKRTKNLGYNVAFLTIGASIGYYLGGQLGSNPFFVDLLGTDNLSVVFLIQGLMNVFLAIFVLFVFNFESNEEKPVKQSMFNSLKYITSLKWTFIVFFISLTLFSMGKVNVEKYLDVYFNDLGYTTSDIGTFVMITGIVSLFASFVIVPLFAKIKRQLPAILFIQLGSALIIFIVFRSTNFIIAVYTLYMMFIMFRTIYQPLEQNYISNHVQNGKYSLTMGIRQSFFSLGMILGPLLGGVLYQVKPLLLFDSSAILFILSGLLVVVLISTNRKNHILDM